MAEEQQARLTQQELHQILKDVAAQGATIKGVEAALVDISQSMRRVATLEEGLTGLQRQIEEYRQDLDEHRQELHRLEEHLGTRISNVSQDADSRLKPIENVVPVLQLSGSTTAKIMVRLIAGGLLVYIGYVIRQGGL